MSEVEYNHAKKHFRIAERCESEITELEREIKDWKTGEAQSEMRFFGLGGEFGEEISAFRDAVILKYEELVEEKKKEYVQSWTKFKKEMK